MCHESAEQSPLAPSYVMFDSRESIRMVRACPFCSARDCVCVATQRAHGDEVVYSESVRCPSCGHASESDGAELPRELREPFLAEHGTWGVRVDVAHADRLPAARALHVVLGLSLRAALALVGQRHALAFQGTRVEAEHLANRLRRAGARADVSRAA